MGLDITHYKATLIRPEILDPSNCNFITETEFECFDASFSYFDEYIQLIDTPSILKTLIFPKKEDEIEEVKEFLKHNDYVFLFEENSTNVAKVVEQYVLANCLTSHLVHYWDTSKWRGIHIYKFDKQIGFYFEEVGYQRKGMNNNFWTRFGAENTTCFTKKEDFEFACTCVDKYWATDTKEIVENRKQLFKQNFVDTYEIKKSWMDISS